MAVSNNDELYIAFLFKNRVGTPKQNDTHLLMFDNLNIFFLPLGLELILPTYLFLLLAYEMKHGAY